MDVESIAIKSIKCIIDRTSLRSSDSVDTTKSDIEIETEVASKKGSNDGKGTNDAVNSTVDSGTCLLGHCVWCAVSMEASWVYGHV